MEEIKKNKFLIIICSLLFIILFVVLYMDDKKDETYYKEDESISLKHYEENEYIPVNISYDQVARIYLQDYVYKLLYKREDAYNLLDSEYREAKFPTFEKFNNYVERLMNRDFLEMTVARYSVNEGAGYRDFDVYDSGDNYYVFREKGVMQYTVYFDRYTVVM